MLLISPLALTGERIRQFWEKFCLFPAREESAFNHTFTEVLFENTEESQKRDAKFGLNK